MRVNVLEKNFFLILYIRKVYILYKHVGVCCRCDVVVIYDITGHWMETTRSINANSLKSYIAMHSGHHEDTILVFETDNNYWE